MKITKIWKSLITAILIVAVIGSCKKDDQEEILGLCPEVIQTDPSNLSTGVALDKIITVSFNENMNPNSIHEGTFTLTGNGEVAGSVNYEEATQRLIFTPSAPLTPKQLIQDWLKGLLKIFQEIL